MAQTMDDIQVLVCDDSALMRNLISRIIDSAEGMHTVGTAMNGQYCLEKAEQLRPDAIVLDIEMPVMTGVEFLKESRKRGMSIPVIILSSVATKGANVTIQCLELGASDFITKPSGSISSSISSVAGTLIEKIASYGGAYARINSKKVYPPDFFMQQAKLKEVEHLAMQKLTASNTEQPKIENLQTQPVLWAPKTGAKEPAVITPVRKGGPIEIVAIGISTGGPNALREIFAQIDPKFPRPILVVQHMPAGFTKEFANSLDKICPLDVKEAKDGDVIQPGTIFIAPGDFHIYVERKIFGTVVRLSHDELRNGHRPSADVLFESVAKIYENRALGVIMTGMGRDGAAQLAEMRRQGAWTLGQDEKSSIVYGMPRVAWELGGVQRQVPLSQMATAINSIVHEHLNG